MEHHTWHRRDDDVTMVNVWVDTCLGIRLCSTRYLNVVKFQLQKYFVTIFISSFIIVCDGVTLLLV